MTFPPLLPVWMAGIDLRLRPRHLQHMVGDCQGGGQAGAFNPEQVDQAGDAMGLRSLHDEILSWSALGHNLRTDAGVAWLQRAVLQPWPIFPHRRIEAVRAGGVDGVVQTVYPFDVRAEACLAPEVDGQMDTQSARYRHRIDQPREG